MAEARETATSRQPPVAIVGMAVLLPGAPDLDTYWHNIVNGVDAITEVPEHRWDAAFYDPQASSGPARADAIYCRRGGFVDSFAEIDPTEFGIMPSSVAATEPDQLIALRVAAAAIADAGGEERLPSRDRIGVILGRGGYLTPGLVRLEQRVRTAQQLVRTLGELVPGIAPEELDRVRDAFTDQLGPHDPAAAIGLVPNLVASRIANRLDLRGPAYSVDAACASALIAIDHAVDELARGRCELVLAGGVHHCHDVTFWSVFAQLRALSARQQIRPFDCAADGIVIGEGTGVVALKRLADAERDGDRVYAVIRGTGVASDGRATSLLNPEPEGQVLALRRAWEAAGLDPAEPGSLDLLEAHGTATPAGDRAELATLERVFGGRTTGRAVIGSVKSMIGHTMPAAGIAGLVKAALAVHHGVFPPTLNCDDPHPALARTRFRPIRSAEPWELGGRRSVRRAAVNAFGFGGINAHVVLEQHAQPALVRAPSVAVVGLPEQALWLSAPTPAALLDMLDNPDVVRAPPAVEGCRLGIVDPTPKRLAMARKVVARGESWRGRNDIWFSPRPLLTATPLARVAFVFPGLEAEFEPQVDDVAARFGLPRPQLDAGNAGRHAAGAVAVGRILDHALRALRITPDAVAGHSVGEWAAMIAAGVYSPAEVDRFLEVFDPGAVQLPDVAFAALGCGVERVADAIRDRPGIVISHDNAPSQSIVCGPSADIDELVGWFRGQGVLGQVLPFRSGFHTPMLEPYLGPIHEAAAFFALHPPALPIWSATTAAPYPAGEAEVRELYVRHLLEPVRFRPLVEAMYADGVRVFVQVGVGQLTALIGDTLRGREHLAIAANSSHRSGLAQLRRVATALWVEGATPLPVDAQAPVHPAARSRPMKLDLSAALVTLDRTAPLLAPARKADPPAKLQALGGPLSQLGELATRYPVADELRGLLLETADIAVAVMGAGTRRAPAVAGHSGAAPAVQPPAPPHVAIGGIPATSSVLRVSMTAMPYLRDHCIYRQREDWPDDGDRWPVVPATTLIQHMIDAAERAAPPGRAVAVHDAQMNRWVAAVPPLDVPVSAEPEADGRIRVAVGEYSQAVIELGNRHPGAPAPWPVDAAAERAPEITARELYTKRWMFHGPQFQGVTELTAIGERHVRGVITAPAAPGALLDNVGQLLGAWIMSTQSAKQVVFPVAVRRIRFFDPQPAAGTELRCFVRIRDLTDATLEADVQLVQDGRVWAQIDGWQDRRFGIDFDVGRFPERSTLSESRPGGWALLFERWPDLASRDLFVRSHLSAAERAEHDACAPRRRRHWVLGRIALKDAVRRWLWDNGSGPLFPAEVRVSTDAHGAPRASGHHGSALPRLSVSVAHCHEAAVAIARPGPTGVGIDIEEVAERDDSTWAVALSAQERALLLARSADSFDEQAVWFTRFWTAKEAVGKAERTGLAGRPQDFAVVAACATELVVRAGSGRSYRVRCERVSNPPDLAEREYVVAWTTGPQDDEEEMR